MNKKRIGILLVLVSLLTGCIKYDATMQLEVDSGFTFTIISALQKEYASSMGDNTSYEEYEKLGYQIEPYSDNMYSGVKLTKKFNSIDDVSSANCGQVELTTLLEQDPSEFVLFNYQKVEDVTIYTANFTYNLELEEGEAGGDFDYSEFNESMVFKYTMTLPNNVKIISENADEKSNNGYTLSWNMKYGELKNIVFSFSVDENALEEIPGDSQTDHNNNNNNNNENNMNNNGNNTSNDEENIINNDNNKDENSVENTKDTTENDNKKSKQSLGSIFGVLISIILIVGLFIYKIKSKKDSVTPNTTMSHHTPPTRK